MEKKDNFQQASRLNTAVLEAQPLLSKRDNAQAKRGVPQPWHEPLLLLLSCPTSSGMQGVIAAQTADTELSVLAVCVVTT